MKKFITQVFVITALFLIAGCGTDNEAVDEFIEYYNKEWIPIHDMKRTEMQSADQKLLDIQEEKKENFEEEAAILIGEEVLPALDEILDRLESVELKHRDVKKMNDLQIKAEEFGRAHIEKGIDYVKGDITDTEYQRGEMELKEKYDDVLNYRDELIEKYNLEYDKEKGKVDGFYELKHKEKE